LSTGTHLSAGAGTNTIIRPKNPHFSPGHITAELPGIEGNIQNSVRNGFLTAREIPWISTKWILL
jgi:hypothetical protein